MCGSKLLCAAVRHGAVVASELLTGVRTDELPEVLWPRVRDSYSFLLGGGVSLGVVDVWVARWSGHTAARARLRAVTTKHWWVVWRDS